MVGAYNNGPSAIPTVLFLTTAVCLLWYLVGAGGESPVMNIGVTLLGVLWVGMFGSFAALDAVARASPASGSCSPRSSAPSPTTSAACSSAGTPARKPLSAGSPNKTWEGLIGGCVVAVIVLVAAHRHLGLRSDRRALGEGLLVGLAIAIAAPLGDLCESLVKRDLGVKDMGTILPGHGGLLDRFDGLLFVLPTVYLLATVKDFFV